MDKVCKAEKIETGPVAEADNRDFVFENFLVQQQKEAELFENTAICNITPVQGTSRAEPRTYLIRFNTRVPVCDDAGISYADHVLVRISFPDDYLRPVHANLCQQVASILYPVNIWHPAVYRNWMCFTLKPGDSLGSILSSIWAVITYNVFPVDRYNSLNPDAVSWAIDGRKKGMVPLSKLPLRKPKVKIRNRRFKVKRLSCPASR